MRRFRQQLPQSDVQQMLAEATNGVLSLVDRDGEPYGVPMSFVYDGDRTIYFHCAREGRKMECLDRCDRASFCIVALDDIKPAEFTTYFRSVIAAGKISRVEDRGEMTAALRMLASKYSAGFDSSSEIEHTIDRVAVLRLEIDSATGKQSIELTRRQ